MKCFNRSYAPQHFLLCQKALWHTLGRGWARSGRCGPTFTKITTRKSFSKPGQSQADRNKSCEAQDQRWCVVIAEYFLFSFRLCDCCFLIFSHVAFCWYSQKRDYKAGTHNNSKHFIVLILKFEYYQIENSLSQSPSLPSASGEFINVQNAHATCHLLWPFQHANECVPTQIFQ